MIRHGRASPQCQNADRSRSGEVLPDDLFRMLRCVIAPRGEARLALAVLEDAVRCLDGNQDPWKFPPRLFQWEAEQWIESRDRAPLFSFENICSILSLDTVRLREQIRRGRAGSASTMRRPAGRRHRITDPVRLLAGSTSTDEFIFRAEAALEGGIIESTL